MNKGFLTISNQSLPFELPMTMADSAGKTLLIVIPALDEEQSIRGTIEQALSARDHIIRHSPVEHVDITVVSDGSTDRTAQFAAYYSEHITLIAFEENKGYGAAIKEAWGRSKADFLGFMDADGTCDPRSFAVLCRILVEQEADVATGCRMNAESRMPVIRRTGNYVFARVLSFLSSTSIRDSASGIRVVRRSSVPRLLPLPDGLHFTPAMSARAVLSGDLHIVEVDVPYYEREGESKLSAGRDGIRFMRAILSAALLYRPSRPLAIVGLGCLAGAAALMTMPMLHYVEHQEILEWMIYRFVVSDLLGTTGVLLLCSAHLSREIVAMTLDQGVRAHESRFVSFFSRSYFWWGPTLLVLLGGSLVVSSFMELVVTGATYEHWSRFIAMSFLVGVAIILGMTWLLDYMLRMIAERQAYLRQ